MRRFVAKTLATLRDSVGQPFTPLKEFSIAGSPAFARVSVPGARPEHQGYATDEIIGG